MRIVLSSLFVFGLVLGATAQDFQKLATVELKTAGESKAFEPDALKCAIYALSKPFDKNDPNRKVANRIIIMWMSVTPDYQFSIDGTAAELMKKNEDVLGLLMAAMTKVALENPSAAGDAGQMKLASYKALLDYCGDAANNVEQTKNLKKAIAANQEGKLKEYLGL